MDDALRDRVFHGCAVELGKRKIAKMQLPRPPYVDHAARKVSALGAKFRSDSARGDMSENFLAGRQDAAVCKLLRRYRGRPGKQIALGKRLPLCRKFALSDA